MRRVLVIVPFPMGPDHLANREAQLRAVELGPGIAFEFHPVKAAPRNYVSASDMALAEIGVLEAGLAAEADGYDAVCIDTMSDSAVAALRSELRIPVIGPGRASMLMALMLGSRFSILAMWAHWRHLYTKTLGELGLTQACVSIRSIHQAPDNRGLLGDHHDQVVERLVEEGQRAVEEDGAEVLLLGSTTMHEAHAALAARLPVPVINPGPLSYKMAELALGLRLSHSRAAYPASPAPQHEVVQAMVDAARRGV
ncbi:MAG: aspartate/glutamate racemase family protein [Pseudomonadota bacterium]